MKKIIAVMAALAVSSLSAFALDITVGARGNFNWGLGTTAEDADDDAEYNGNLGGGFGVYANFGLMELAGGSLGIQPEINMNFNNGMNFKEEESESFGGFTTTEKTESTVFDTTIDIPVFVTFSYPIMDALSIGGGLGCYLSIPFGIDTTYSYETSMTGYPTMSDSGKGSDSMEFKAKMNFGLAFDVNGAYKVGPGSIVLDIRYMLDLTPTSVSRKYKSGSGDWSDYNDVLTRRMLTIGAGYQIKF